MSNERAGSLVPRARAPWVSVITHDAIQHYAWGVGDNNPLWVDRSHAEGSRWGGPIAPPCLLYAVDETTVAPGHDGRRRVLQLVHWVWWDVLREGDELLATANLIGEQADGPDPVQHGLVEFRTTDDRIVAMAETWCARPAEPAVPIADRPELRYERQQLEDTERAIMSESRRGAAVRFWEDTGAGDDIGSIVRGPLSIMDVVAWCAGTQGVASAADGYCEGGLNDESATGPQQVAWMANLVTDWMGDDAFLHRLDVSIAANPPLGSTTTVSGRVEDLSAAGSAVVRVDMVATSQHDEVTASGRATVVLPSGHGPSGHRAVAFPMVPA